MINHVKTCFKKYAVFKGRASRAEYWYFALFGVLAGIMGMILDNVSGMASAETGFIGPIYMLVALALLLPSISVMVRRLHDTGKSGWMYWIALVPFVGGIWLLVLFIKDSQPGENEYGENPKGVEAVK